MSGFSIVKLTDPIQFTNVAGGLVPKGAYNGATDYAVGDSVDYQGSSYVMHTDAGAGTLPTNTSFWQVLANKGADSTVPGPQGDPGEGVPAGGTSGQVLAKINGTDYNTEWIDPAGAVDSVNGQTGVVVLDADDIDDTSTTHKFVTSTDITKLGNLSGTNTGDQDLSSYATTAAVAAGYQPLDADLTALAAAGNSATLAATTASFLTADETKLDGIAAGAEVNVNADWNAVSGDAQILNKPTISGSNTGDVSLTGTPDYITLSGQTITRGLIDLATDVTGDLPFANLTQLSAHQVLARAGSGTGDVAGVTMGNDTILGRAGSGDVDDLSATQVRSILNVANGATANSSDATLLDRANHTGTQTSSTISDFNSASRAQTEAELVAGANITITPSGSGATRQLTIASSGGGGVTSLNTLTGDVGVYGVDASGGGGNTSLFSQNTIAGSDLSIEIKGIVSSDNSVTITDNGNVVDLTTTGGGGGGISEELAIAYAIAL